MNGATWLLDAWVRDFAQVLEMMTAQSCAVTWSQSDAPPPDVNLWWKQAFSMLPSAPLFVGATAKAWSDMGAQALKAAGVDMFEQAEAKSTYLELVQQSLSSVATSLTSREGSPVEAVAGEVIPTAPPSGVHAVIAVTIDDVSCELSVLVSTPLVAHLEEVNRPATPASAPHTAPPPSGNAGEDSHAAASPPDFLLDVELPVSISFGHARLPLKDVLKLTTGSVVELDRQPEEVVDVIVNNTVIARGEVVVVEGNYGVRISQILNRQTRLALRAEDRSPQRNLE
jgi:flagellar motor switch protein FliN/FliY